MKSKEDIIIAFRQGNSDDRVLKSLLEDTEHEYDQEVLAKALDKAKLVQKEVQVRGKNGQIHTRKQWVKAGEDQPAPKQSKVQEDTKETSSKPKQEEKKEHWTKVGTSQEAKSQIAQMLASGKSREDCMSDFKAQGVTWKEHSNPAINWMRAAMAMNKYLTSDSIPKESSQSQTNSQSDKKKPQISESSVDNKAKIKELVEKLGGKDGTLKTMESKGVTWQVHAHAGINWMRAMQALNKAVIENPSLPKELLEAKGTQDTKKQLSDTQKKVQELQDLVSQIQNPTAQQVIQQSSKADVLKGITTDTMSDYEKKHFGDSISSASPESLRNYRTLGMCAGDKESEQYLAGLYQKYSDAVQGNISTPKYDPNVDSDPLRNKLQGVVNKQVVGVVKSSLKNARKRMSQFTAQQKLLEPWVDPNMPLTDEQKDFIKNGTRPPHLGDRRRECQLEQDCSHKMMHKTLDKFKISKEYGKLAEEYDQLLTEFDQLTQSNFTFQCAINGVGNGSKIRSAKEYEDSLKNTINLEIEKCEEALASNPSENSKKFYQKKLNELKDTQSKINGDDLVKAAEIRQKLFDSKFTDLNVNLYHYKMMATQLSYQYEIKKDFVVEYPILSKDNLDKLDIADEDSLTNLSLYAGMFKPSLTKGGKSAKDALMDKFSERQAFLDAYGGVTQVSGNSSYAENNEIRCKVSKADPKKAQSIIDNIANDWDKKSHGGMKYRIKGVYEVSGLAAEKQFDKIKQQHSKYKGTKVGGKDCGSDMFYHGTGSMATSLILGHSGEFKLVKAKVGRMLGDGIYLADKSSKSAQYIGDAGYSRSGISGSLMIVEASLGDTLSARTSQGYSHDSVFAGKQHGLLNSEWCVHDPHAVIPRYLVEMEIL